MAKEALDAIVGIGYLGVGNVVKHIGQGPFDGEVASPEELVCVPVAPRILVEGFLVQVVLMPSSPFSERPRPVYPVVGGFNPQDLEHQAPELLPCWMPGVTG